MSRGAPHGDETCHTLSESRRSALDMIAHCLRHQHPEAFGGAPVPGPPLPIEIRGGRDEALSCRHVDFFPPEAMGHPGAVGLEPRPGIPGADSPGPA